ICLRGRAPAGKHLCGKGQFRMPRTPDALGGGWHVDVLYTEFRQSIDERVGYRRQRTDTARFAGALDAKWVGLGRNRIAFDLHVTQVARAWHGVIHERGGDELPSTVEM